MQGPGPLPEPGQVQESSQVPEELTAEREARLCRSIQERLEGFLVDRTEQIARNVTDDVSSKVIKELKPP